MIENTPSTPRMPRFAKVAMAFQAYLLRQNWREPMGDEIMVILTFRRQYGNS
jgi:hypothetical protein